MASSARDGAGIAVSKFYGESLPRPTLMGDVQAPASDIAEKQDARRGFVPATQPLMGAALQPCHAAVSGSWRLSTVVRVATKSERQ